MINLHNCETWFMLYADGELSAAERTLVERFLEDHPDFRSAFDQLQALKFLPDESVVFPDRFLLYQEQPTEETGRESMSAENRYQFEPDLSVSFPNKQLLYKTESPVRVLQETKQEKVLGTRGTVRWLMPRARNWADTGARHVAAALTVTAIGLLWFFFSKGSIDMPQQPIASATADGSKETAKDNPKGDPKSNPDNTAGAILYKRLDNESLVAGSDKPRAIHGEASSVKAATEKKQRNDHVLNKTTVIVSEGMQHTVKSTSQKRTLNTITSILQPGGFDTEEIYAEKIVQLQTAATTSLAQTIPRSNLSPEIRALATERIAAQGSIAAPGSSVTNAALSSTALSSPVLSNAQDHSTVIREAKNERPRTALRRLLGKINATIEQELEYEEDNKYIQVASFKIPLSKEEKK